MVFIKRKSNKSTLYENSEILDIEFEFFQKMKKSKIIQSINIELDILKLLNFNPSYDLDKETLLSIYFLFTIFSNLIGYIFEDYKTCLNWRDLFYFSLMENPSPEDFIKNYFKEIKRKRSYFSTKYLNSLVKNSNFEFEVKRIEKLKQLKLDNFI